MFTLVGKEVSSFFGSFAAYIIISIFLVVSGLFLWVFPGSSILDDGYAGLDAFFEIAPYLFMFLVPAVTMRSLAEEKKEGTFELLATLPLTDWQIIVGKFLGNIVIVIAALLPTAVYYVTVYCLGVTPGNLDSGAVIGSYLGLFLLGGAFCAVGIFTSSVTNNQVVAFALSVFLCYLLFSGFESVSGLEALQPIAARLTALGVYEHYQSISRGVADTRDLLYFFSFQFFFLALAKTVLGGRKW